MILEGKLFFYSETGTEGGYWAFQDGRYISIKTPDFGVTDGMKVWDVSDRSKSGLASNAELFLHNQWVPIPDPILQDHDFGMSTLFLGEQRGDTAADERLMNRYNFRIKYHGEGGGTPSSEPLRPYGIPVNGLTRVTVVWSNGEVERQRLSATLLAEQWDRKGTHVLENGYRLEILHPHKRSVVWNGIIDLKPYELFTENVQGLWIHADQIGMSRNEWSDYFLKEFPARLRPSGLDK
jgi:hypothetical protein